MYRCALAILLSVTAAFSLQVIHEEADVGELPHGENILWTDPGDVASLDFQSGVGGPEGQPQPPFRFAQEDMSGSIPKVNVIDNRGVAWNVKWGPEARASVYYLYAPAVGVRLLHRARILSRAWAQRAAND